jgi:DNA-binding MarR family transcriptional regulator
MIDLSTQHDQQTAMADFFFAYQAFTTKPDEMLARRGLSRVHHRILFFIAVYPGLSVTQLLSHLGVSKQALNIPLRQLLEMRLVLSSTAVTDKRRRQLDLSNAGSQLELALRKEQTRLLQLALQQSGETAMAGWLQFNQALGQARSE